MARLTQTEKYVIQGMLKDKKTEKQIAKQLDKPLEDIQKFIEKLDTIVSDITKVQIETSTKSKSESPKNTVDRTSEEDDIIALVLRRLKTAGLTERDAQGVMNAALKTLTKQGLKVENEAQLYKTCISRLNAGSLMVKKTPGGREGVCIMTPGASSKNDGKTQSNMSRKADGNLWNIKEARIINGKKGKSEK